MSNEPRFERIRPCLKCGGLVPYSALRCHLCGNPTEGAPREGERVRACLSCGVIVRFDQDPCPECGAPARLEPQEDDRVKTCATCGSLTAFQDLYCGKCGDVAIDWERDEIESLPEIEEPLQRRFESPWLAGALWGGGLLVLAFAGARILL